MSASAKKLFASVVKQNVAPGGKSLYYNNVGLFSDPYLDSLQSGKHTPIVLQNWDTEGLPEFSECYEWMLSTWDEMKDILPNLSEAQLEERWIKPILQRLGWEYEVQDRLKKWGKTEIPDYSLFESRKAYLKAQGCKTDEAYFNQVLAVADAKQMGVPLDGSKLDKSNPSYQIVWYQQITGKQWGILTDGKYWRLYSTRSQSKYNNFYEVNVEKFLGLRDDEQFKYFCNFFRKAAFVKDANNSQSFLDVVFEGGEHYAREVETRLNERAFHLVEFIAQGFASSSKPSSVGELKVVYEQSLYYLFRLMFILNCEAKGLLNVHKQSDYYPLSLRCLGARIKDEHEANQQWSRLPRSYNHIADLFNLLTTGDNKIGIHGFGNEVFSAGDMHFYKENRIPDSYLNKVLLELAFAEDKKEKKLRAIDYKRLAADHLGSLFEGLLEYKLESVKGGSPGEVLLVNSSGERKVTGSYYTPRYVVDHIVKNTLAPLVVGKSIEEILQIKVLDPAMGSGHFLLGAVRFLEDTILERLSELKTKPFEPQMVNWKVLHSCVHGVDINPLAVELAKFSLWIYTAKNGYELEPLANQLVSADSILNEEVWIESFQSAKKNKGFDAVIGNPPYVRQELLEGVKSGVEDRYKVFHKMADFYTLFVELGVGVLRPGGRFGMIIGNKWMKAEYGKAMRGWLSSQGVESLVDFGDLPVFPGVAAYPCVLTIEKGNKSETINYNRILNLDFDDLAQEVIRTSKKFSLGELGEHAWSFECGEFKSIGKKLESNSTSLAKYIEGSEFYGIKTGCNEAFVIDETTAKTLLKENPQAKAIIKPFARGRDIHAYSQVSGPKFIILTRRGIDIKKYPAVEKFLRGFKDRLEPKPKGWKGEWKGRKEGTYKWYELQDAVDYIDDFNKPKIMYVAFQVKPAFAMDRTGYLANNAVWCIGKEDYFLLGFLNSRIGWYLISKNCTQIRGGYQLIFKYLGKVPIRLPKTETEKKLAQNIERKVREFSSAKLVTDKMRAAIDELFYSYYGLTKIEIGALEAASYGSTDAVNNDDDDMDSAS